MLLLYGVSQFKIIPISHAPGYGGVTFLWHGSTPIPGSASTPGMWGCPSSMEWGTLILEYGGSAIPEYGNPTNVGLSYSHGVGCPLPRVGVAPIPG